MLQTNIVFGSGLIICPGFQWYTRTGSDKQRQIWQVCVCVPNLLLLLLLKYASWQVVKYQELKYYNLCVIEEKILSPNKAKL